MGFNFARSKKNKSTPGGSSPATTGENTAKKFDREHVARAANILRSRRKLLSKVIPRRSKSKSNPSTPNETDESTEASARTGGTIGLQHHQEYQWVTEGAVEIAIEDDPLSQSVLDEREFIRQQLFYGEQGVEVAAQFSPNANGTSTTTLYPANVQKVHRPNHHPQGGPSGTKVNRQEEKKEDMLSPLDSRHAATVSPDYSIKQTPATAATANTNSPDDLSPQETPLPPTPYIEPSDVDPLKRFPAVAAAVAKAEASRPRAPVVRTVSEHSNSVSYASTAMEDHSLATSVTPYHQRLQMTAQKQQQPTGVVTPPTPSPEKPFDEVDGPEDPTIAEMDQAERESASRAESSVPPDGNSTEGDSKVQEDADITRKLLEAFNCGVTDDLNCGVADDFSVVSSSTMENVRSCRLVDAFYDNTCWTYREAADHKRPYYDEQFAQRFLQDITEEGVNVLWHLPPSESSAGDSSNWSGRSVLMQIKPGSCYSKNDVEPKLQWKALSGGKRKKISVRSIPLLDIQSIATFSDTIVEGEDDEEFFTDACGGGIDEDVCLFAITTDEGDVHVFESTSPRERDLLVAGLKNVVARLCFHLVVGDAGASSELYCEEVKNPSKGELPACTDATKNMNRIAHALMD